MNTIKLPLLASALGALLTTAAPAKLQVFEDRFGRMISAELLSHKGDSEFVKLRRGDGREFEARLDLFCERDRLEILEWMKNTRPDLDYHFRFEESKFPRGGATVYRIDFRNASRDQVTGLQVVYRVLVRASGWSAPSGSVHLGGGIYAVERRYALQGSLKFNEGRSFDTPRLRNALGVMLRVYDDRGEVVGGYKSSNPRLAGLSWERNGSREIRKDAEDRAAPLPAPSSPGFVAMSLPAID